MRPLLGKRGLAPWIAFVLSIFILGEPTRAADVIFYAVAKARKFNQNVAGAPTLGGNTPYRFIARVTPAASGSVLTATVSAIGGAALALSFDALAGSLEYSAKFATESALDAAFPGGPNAKYMLNISTLHDGQRSLTLGLPLGNYPNGPHISNYTAAQAINPGADFSLTWDAFVGATANDYVSVLIGDATTGQAIFRTPEPFQPGALKGTDTSVTIPAGTLNPNITYQAELTFYTIVSADMTSYSGAVGAVAYASFTDFILTTVADPVVYTFSFRHFASGGKFANGTNATGSFPVAINGYRAQFTAANDTTLPPATQVLFTGPAGSGLDNMPGDPQASSITSTEGFYYSPKIGQPATAPPGTWSVSYKAAMQSFTKPDPQAASRLVVPLPKVSLDNGAVKTVTWSYWDPVGLALAGTPAFLTGIRIQAQDATGAFLYDSGPLPPKTVNHLLTSPLSWTAVNTIRFLYGDSLGNSYAIGFPRVSTPPPELAAEGYAATGMFILRLTGQASHTYSIQSSTDLAHWTDLTTTNLPSATIELIDPHAGDLKYRFYRASLVN